MNERLTFPVHQAKILNLLLDRSGEHSLDDIVTLSAEPHPQLAGALQALAEAELVTLRQEEYAEYVLGPKGKALPNGQLPERAVMEALVANGGAVELRHLAEVSGLPQKDAGRSLKPLEQRGLAQRDAGVLKAVGSLAEGKLPPLAEHEKLLAHLSGGGDGTPESLCRAAIDMDQALKGLQDRGGLVTKKERRRWWASLSPKGEALRGKEIVVKRSVNVLDTELLKDGAWREVEFRPYDVQLASKRVVAGKEHPFRRVLEQTRRVFLEMGFEEVHAPMVDSAFWVFDALFQPQDHPAREMQDTFYAKKPDRIVLPDETFVEQVRRTHEDGGDTGSRGWRYQWNRQTSEMAVLRTHTTSGTIRALAADPSPPRKVFIVGTVFRRETMDYKHLPLFHQVDGIIIDRDASLSSLLGTLDAFYRKMGFDKFEFRPGFFPYTEPSVEVFVWHELKQDWVEMGGSGVFREEVTKPFGCEVPVLAWGLGLERLAMFKYGLDSIRDLYVTDIEWLREVPLCR